jgi:hypothetical protein
MLSHLVGTWTVNTCENDQHNTDMTCNCECRTLKRFAYNPTWYLTAWLLRSVYGCITSSITSFRFSLVISSSCLTQWIFSVMQRIFVSSTVTKNTVSFLSVDYVSVFFFKHKHVNIHRRVTDERASVSVLELKEFSTNVEYGCALRRLLSHGELTDRCIHNTECTQMYLPPWPSRIICIILRTNTGTIYPTAWT